MVVISSTILINLNCEWPKYTKGRDYQSQFFKKQVLSKKNSFKYKGRDSIKVKEQRRIHANTNQKKTRITTDITQNTLGQEVLHILYHPHFLYNHSSPTVSVWSPQPESGILSPFCTW